MVHILAYQSIPFASQEETRQTKANQESLQTTVSFVEDRFRAVQVELVAVSAKPNLLVPELQLLLARCQIIILYLMSDCTAAVYEKSFGYKALTTALTNFWNHLPAKPPSSPSSGDADQQQPPNQSAQVDEILAYTVLVRLCQAIVESGNDHPGRDGSPWRVGDDGVLTAVSNLYRRHVIVSNHDKLSKRQQFPFFQWSLRLLSTIVLGHCHVALRMLLQDDMFPDSDDEDSCKITTIRRHFHTFARCCMAPAIPHLRYQALQAYNASFAKEEKVPAKHIARLLAFSNSSTRRNSLKTAFNDDDDHNRNHRNDAEEAALDFGELIGLRTAIINEKEGNTACLVFKAGPLHAKQLSAVQIRDDAAILKVSRDSCRVDAEGMVIPPMDCLFGVSTRSVE